MAEALTMDTPAAGARRLWRGLASSLRLSLTRLRRSPYLWSTIALASVPVLMAVLIVVVKRDAPGFRGDLAWVHSALEIFIRMLYLHFIIFFVANTFGFSVVRQELEERTLHYLILQPLPRWIMLLGKFLAYLILSTLICIASLWITYFILALPCAGPRGVTADLFGQGRFVILARESLVLMLGLLVYGAVAMLAGSLFKAQLYMLFLWIWEGALPYLPSTLKFWTLTHYLHSLLPEQLLEQKKLFELLGEPASAALSWGVLLGVALLTIALAMVLFQSRECLYGES